MLAISTRPRTPRSTPGCRPWAGSAPIAAVTWSSTTPWGCSSAVAPTTRSSWVGAASSSARSTRRFSACRAWWAPRRRYAGPAPATRCWSATSRSTRRSTRPTRWSCSGTMPAALVPRLAVVDVLPTRTSGKVDRDALPWPLPTAAERPASRGLHGTMAWLAELWLDVLGADVRGADRRLLRPRRRQPHGGAGRLAPAGPLPRRRGRRHLRAADRRRAGDVPRPADGRRPDLGPHGAADAAEDPGRTGRRDAAAARAGRATLAGLDRDRLPLLADWLGLDACSRSRRGGCSPRLAGLRHPARPDAARRGRRPGPAAPVGPASTRAAARSTCGCGWPSAWSTSWAPPGCAGAP